MSAASPDDPLLGGVGGGLRCPLCDEKSRKVALAPSRPIFGCPCCGLRFVPAEYHLSPGAEQARYRLHQNSLDDAGYVGFLTPALEALQRWLAQGAGRPARVLDYGSGPAPVLVELLKRAGIDAVGYDPVFGPSLTEEAVFDAVVSTEVFEHFRNPARELDRLSRLLRPGAILVVLTSLVPPDVDFGRWYYATDLTHIAFYSKAVFGYIASRWPFEPLEICEPNLIVLRRQADSA